MSIPAYDPAATRVHEKTPNFPADFRFGYKAATGGRGVEFTNAKPPALLSGQLQRRLSRP
jgi:hypothetical protein